MNWPPETCPRCLCSYKQARCGECHRCKAGWACYKNGRVSTITGPGAKSGPENNLLETEMICSNCGYLHHKPVEKPKMTKLDPRSLGRPKSIWED